MPFQNSSKWWWDSRENTRSLSIAWRGTRRWICSICEGSRRRSCASMSRRSGSWRLSWRSWRPSRRFRFGCLALGICFCFLGFICIFFPFWYRWCICLEYLFILHHLLWFFPPFNLMYTMFMFREVFHLWIMFYHFHNSLNILCMSIIYNILPVIIGTIFILTVWI